MAIQLPRNNGELLGCLFSFFLYRLFLALGVAGFVGGVLALVFASEEGDLSLWVVAFSGGALTFGGFFIGIFVDAWRKRPFSLGWKLPLVLFLFGWLMVVILGWSIFYGDLPLWAMSLLTLGFPIAFVLFRHLWKQQQHNSQNMRSVTCPQCGKGFRSAGEFHHCSRCGTEFTE